MPLKCQICGKEYLYDGKICHTCEETAITSGLSSQYGKDHKWRCDNFIELNGLVFGRNLDTRKDVGLKMIECPDCGEKYSYDRKICHTCEGNSIPFGKIFEPAHKARGWNCDTAMACMELLASDLDTVESFVKVVPHLEKLENNERDWNIFNNIQINERKLNNFLKFE